jgi:hypothetical protein
MRSRESNDNYNEDYATLFYNIELFLIRISENTFYQDCGFVRRLLPVRGEETFLPSGCQSFYARCYRNRYFLNEKH